LVLSERLRIRFYCDWHLVPGANHILGTEYIMGLAVVIGTAAVIGAIIVVGVVREVLNAGYRAVPDRDRTRAARGATPSWRTRHWATVAAVAEDLAQTGFPAASGLVAAALVDRCRSIAALAATVDRRGSIVDSMLHEDLVTELALLERAQQRGTGAVVLVRWPRARVERVAMAPGLTGAERAELHAHDAELAARLFRELPPRTTELPVLDPA
jgi:hypothetical protein